MFKDHHLFLALQEKSNIKKQQEEAQEAAERQKGKVMVTFDLVGRKVFVCSFFKNCCLVGTTCRLS
jgi:hypothetical protein